MTVDFPRRRPEGCDATQMRERRFAFQPVRVVTRGDQQDRGGVRPDAVDVQEARRGSVHDRPLNAWRWVKAGSTAATFLWTRSARPLIPGGPHGGSGAAGAGLGLP